MSDILERLRKSSDGAACRRSPELVVEAAAEIERLRAEINGLWRAALARQADLAEAEALLLDIGSRDWWQRRAAWLKQRNDWLARRENKE